MPSTLLQNSEFWWAKTIYRPNSVATTKLHTSCILHDLDELFEQPYPKCCNPFPDFPTLLSEQTAPNEKNLRSAFNGIKLANVTASNLCEDHHISKIKPEGMSVKNLHGFNYYKNNYSWHTLYSFWPKIYSVTNTYTTNKSVKYAFKFR